MKTRSGGLTNTSRTLVQKTLITLKIRQTRKSRRSQVSVSQDCPICYDSLDQTELLFPLSCGHSFHIACVNTHLAVALDSSQVPITCPVADCRAELT
jgi:hypothetical protein